MKKKLKNNIKKNIHVFYISIELLKLNWILLKKVYTLLISVNFFLIFYRVWY